MKRAKIVISDDIMTLDEAEVTFSQKKQMLGMVESFLKCTKDAETAEVYDMETGKMIARYIMTKRGKIVPTDVEHFNWGGKRPRSGRPPLGVEAKTNRVIVYVNEDMAAFIESLGRAKNDFLRQAIQEKREREIKS